MARIKTSNGYIKYKPITIFEGVKLIDKPQSWENLLILKGIFDKHGIMFQLAYGTLLGAVRERDFITHDEDIDLALLEEDKQKFFDVLPEFFDKGFQFARYDRKGLVSIIRKGEYIDLYFFRPWKDDIRTASGCLMYERYLTETTLLEFKGVEFTVPKDYIDFLVFEYGENWMTPVQYFDYTQSRDIRFKERAKAYIKEILPDFIYMPLSAHYEKKLVSKYLKKVERYQALKNKA